MRRVQECSRQHERPSSRALAVAANAAAAYPLFALGALYGQWLLSWWVLGHQPRPSLDDPKYIDGASWMHEFTGLALMGFVPMACATAVLNTLNFVRHQNPGLGWSMRILAIVGLWLGALLLLQSDPGLVGSWWLD